jgi:transcription elongation factor Elf1
MSKTYCPNCGSEAKSKITGIGLGGEEVEIEPAGGILGCPACGIAVDPNEDAQLEIEPAPGAPDLGPPEDLDPPAAPE